MRSLKHTVRRGFLAAVLALGVLPQVANAESTASFDEATGAITVEGLKQVDRAELLFDPARVILQVQGLDATRGMPVTVAEDEAAIHISPHFALRAGTDYVLKLDLHDIVQSFDVSLPALDAPIPQLTGFTPSQAVIPANTLRLYLTFSEPMSRGALRDAVTLLSSNGAEVPNPFLTLAPELWDTTQTRATLLFDPGRIKQGVGPNVSHGAPLAAGESYRLVIDASMRSAEGVSLGQDVRIAFRVGPSEHRPIEPTAWQILPPEPGTHRPLSLAFDRIMDSGAVRRLISVRRPDGQLVRGVVETDGGGWSLLPDQPWNNGTYTITVDPELEDVSGNAVGQAFDAQTGTIGVQQNAVTLDVRIGG